MYWDQTDPGTLSETSPREEFVHLHRAWVVPFGERKKWSHCNQRKEVTLGQRYIGPMAEPESVSFS